MSLELRSALQDITDSTHPIRVLTRIYGLGGKDFLWRMLLRCFVKDFRLMPKLLITMASHRVRQKIAHSHSIMHPHQRSPVPRCHNLHFRSCNRKNACKRWIDQRRHRHAQADRPGNRNLSRLWYTGQLKSAVKRDRRKCGLSVPDRLRHGDNHCLPKTAFRIPYIHNLFQNGAATLSGLVEVFEERQNAGNIPKARLHLSWQVVTAAWISAWVLHSERHCADIICSYLNMTTADI